MAAGNKSKYLRLENATSRVTIAPELGAGLVSFEALTATGSKPVLGPTNSAEPSPFDLALNVLVPFSNRISGGGFSFAGRFHRIAPNLAGEPYPIHGDGFQKAWSVDSADQNHANLGLDNGQIGPFKYAATIRYDLKGPNLTMALSLTNTGERLPYGGGFHPWLLRYPDTSVQFNAQKLWTEDARHLPVEEIAIQPDGQWDFSAARNLPSTLVNNAFAGWDGSATIIQPTLGLSVKISAPEPLTTAILYSPGAQADFFCFEPVSHAVDAHNQLGQPGLKVLDNGESLQLITNISWADLPVDPAP